MFSESKDEVALILMGTAETDNPLDDGECYQNIVIKRPLGVTDFDLLQIVQSELQPSNTPGDCILYNLQRGENKIIFLCFCYMGYIFVAYFWFLLCRL